VREISVGSKGFELLERAQELVARAWCQGADARDAGGRPIDPWAPDAASWSLLGAIVAVLEREAAETGEMALDELAAALYALAEQIDTDSLVAWNDEPRRSQAEVVGVLGKAATEYDPAWAVVHVSSN
jgi:hypothetical protein